MKKNLGGGKSSCCLDSRIMSVDLAANIRAQGVRGGAGKWLRGALYGAYFKRTEEHQISI